MIITLIIYITGKRSIALMNYIQQKNKYNTAEQVQAEGDITWKERRDRLIIKGKN